MPMENVTKRDQILNAFQELLESEYIQQISVNEIAKKAGIGKGSVYYYFSSKDEILSALIQRTYSKALKTATELVSRTDISIYDRLSTIMTACIESISVLLKNKNSLATYNITSERSFESAYIHQQFMKHSIIDFKDVYTQIIQQEIDSGNIRLDCAAEIAEIILIVFTVKIDNILSPSSADETAKTLQALITLLEIGSGNSERTFQFKI